ncbi:MAG: fused MFS/spermidine synthase [Alphaproteobacteria bacterium]|nr:fused MFS/spermidine synthase [Alphaproteobacteria bacterium]
MSGSASTSPSRRRSIPFLLPVIFFVSGFPALIYQLTWQRMLFSVYGINVEAVTVIVSGFLLGLGLGSFAGGRVSAMRNVNLLAAFGAIEFAIAAIGWVSLDVLRRFGFVAAGWSVPVTTAAMLALLVVPTLLMGATLPILVAYLVRRSANVGRSVGLLYFVNTLGSAVACFVSGVFLMRVLGMQGSVAVAAVFNMAVGATALLAATLERRRGVTSDAAAAEPRGGEPGSANSRLVGAMVLAGLAGYLALSYEILWFRAFSLATGTASAFALVLGAYLFGIAAGSLAGRRFCSADAPRGAILHVLVLSLVAYAAVGLLLLPLSGMAALLGALVPAMLALVALHSFVGGLAFPLIAHLGVPPDRAAGRGVSNIYLANILGSVAGSLATGFVVMDFWGLPEVTALLTVLCLGLAAAMLRWQGAGERRSWALAGLALAAVAVPLAIGPMFAGLYERLIFREEAIRHTGFADTVENKSGVINVTPEQVVYGGGFYDGRIQVSLMDDQNLLVRPAVLNYFHPAPKNVLMVGLATGAWVQLLAANPAVEKLTVIEINRGYLELIAGHEPVRSILRNPKIEIVVDDARRWLNRHPDRRFDAILQNTTWHFRSNVTNLLSREYVDLAVRRLSPGGVALYNTTFSARAQRTACMRYPQSVRYINMMVVSQEPLRTDRERLDRALAAMRVDGAPLIPDDEAGARRRAEILASTVMPDRANQNVDAKHESCASILARTTGLPIITDDNMGEEWRSALPDDRLLNAVVHATKSFLGLVR